jgi:streptogramin lyase
VRKPALAPLVGLAAFVALALATRPASALDPGDLVIGVETDLHAVDPETGALELLSEGPEGSRVTGIAVRSGGTVFFTEVSFLTSTAGVWRFDPDTGERRELAALNSVPGLALDGARSLVVPIPDASSAPGTQPELWWLDAETGDVTRALPLPSGLIGISDVDVDHDGRAVLSSTRAGITRVDPRTGEMETLSSARGFAIAVEADGSLLLPPLGSLSVPPNVLRIDPETGAQQVLSAGGLLGRVTGIAVEADGGIVVTSEAVFGDDPSAVLRVDPDDGAQALVVGDLPDASAIAVVPPAVAIDVLPRQIAARPGARGILPVLLSASHPVDAESLAFGPDGAAPVRSLALRRGRDPSPRLLLLFRADETGLAPGDREACLAGSAGPFDFEACDDVVVRGTPAGPRERRR